MPLSLSLLALDLYLYIHVVVAFVSLFQVLCAPQSSPPYRPSSRLNSIDEVDACEQQLSHLICSCCLYHIVSLSLSLFFMTFVLALFIFLSFCLFLSFSLSCFLFSLYSLFFLFLLSHSLCLSPLSISILLLSLSLSLRHIHWCDFYNRTEKQAREGIDRTKDTVSKQTKEAGVNAATVKEELDPDAATVTVKEEPGLNAATVTGKEAPGLNAATVKETPGAKVAVASTSKSKPPCYVFCNRVSSFNRQEEILQIKEADDMWNCFMKGLDHFQTGPKFGSAYLVAFVVESLESRYKTSSASQRINFLQIHTMGDVFRTLTQAFQTLLAKTSANSRIEKQDSLMAIFEQCLTYAKEHEKGLPGPSTQMQAQFTRDEDKLKFIGDLKETTSRICGWLELDAGTIQLVRVKPELPPSLAVTFEPPKQCSDVYSCILRERALPAFVKRQRSKETMTAKLNRLCFGLLPSVADCTPVALSGDTFMHLVGPPIVQNHFFMIVMTKTTDGVAVAKFDSCAGCSTNLRVSTNSEKNRCTEYDLIGFIQAFLAINKNIIFAEKSDAECKKILENLTIYTPCPTYNQPIHSNACWLFSIAVAEQVIANLPDLAASPNRKQAYAFFDKIIASVANILKDSNALPVWIQKVKSENWDNCQSDHKVLSNLESKSSGDIFVGPKWQVDECSETKTRHDANSAYAAEGFCIDSAKVGKDVFSILEAQRKKLGKIPFSASTHGKDRAMTFEQWKEHCNTVTTLVRDKLLHCLSVENLWKDNGIKIQQARWEKLAKIICILQPVKTPAAINKLATMFLNNPSQFVKDGQGTVVARTEQNWQDYGDRCGGGDLALCVNTTNDKSSKTTNWNPEQAIILYATETRAYIAGSVKGSKSEGSTHDPRVVNTVKDTDFHFSYKGDSKNRVECFHGTIPGCMWSKDTWITVSPEFLKRATTGGQSSIYGSASSMVVSNWRSIKKGGNGILDQLTAKAKLGRRERNTLDFRTIVGNATNTNIAEETKAVNCLDIPGQGDCLTQACCLNILTSADPLVATKFYDAMFPSTLHFTSLHTYVMQDSLNGCTRFWFARWLCKKHGIRNVLSKVCARVVFFAEGSSKNIHPNMLISDFLNLIASNSAMAQNSHAHWLCPTLITFFVEFLSCVLTIPVALLILKDDGTQLTIHPDGSLCKTREDLQQSYFLVVKHENGNSTAGSHYRPVLLDYQITKDANFTSCGLLPHASLPRFFKDLLSDQCDRTSLTTSKNINLDKKGVKRKKFEKVSVAFYENQPNEHEKVLPLYHPDRFSTKLLFWRVSLICDEQHKFIYEDLESDSSASLAMTLLQAPLYALNLLAPYSRCSEQILKASGNCMAMFQACPATPEQHSLFAQILRSMAGLLHHLSQIVISFASNDILLPRGPLSKKKEEIRQKGDFDMFIGMMKDTNDTSVIKTLCDNCEMTSTVCVRNFAGIPSQLYWALLSAVVQRPIIILTDVVTTWDANANPLPLDSDLKGHKYHAGSLFDDDGEVCIANVQANANLALPAYLMGLKDPCSAQTYLQATHTAAISAILNKDQDGQPCGNTQELLGNWDFGHYARNCTDITIVPIIPIILSSSSLAMSGYMPVMSLQHLKLDSPKYLKGTEDVSLRGLSLVDLVEICRKSLQSRKIFFESAKLIPDLFFSMGLTGYVPQLDTSNPHEELELLPRENLILRNVHNLAKYTREASENEIQAWLGFGNKELSQIQYSNKKNAGNLLQQWFMKAKEVVFHGTCIVLEIQ